MTTQTPMDSTGHQPQLLDQTVVVIGGSAGIGLETARRARAEGANVILTGRDPERLERHTRRLGMWSPSRRAERPPCLGCSSPVAVGKE